MYSKPCNEVKIIAKTTVKNKAKIPSVRLLLTIEWCAQVTVQPDNKRIKVFKNGISHGSKTATPFGGQIEPISTAGAKLLWKKAQKNAKKNKISDIMNKITPYLNPCWTIPVWCPSKVDSLITSRHQTNIVVSNSKKLKLKTKEPCLNACIYKTPPTAQEKAEKDATKGHGLGSTKWKGCRCKVLEILNNEFMFIFERNYIFWYC